MSLSCNSKLIVLQLMMAALCAAILSSASAQAASITKHRTEIVMLGTAGGPVIRKERAEPSTLLIVDGTRYLIDCGTGALRRMVEAGVPAQTVHTIFITHHHPDHDLDLANIMASDFFDASWRKTKAKWNIYGPPGTRRMVNAAERYISVPFDTFAAEGLTGRDMKPYFIAHDIAHPGLVYKDKNIRVTAVENTHYILMPARYRKHMKSYSYRIHTPNGVIVFTGDTGPSKAVTNFAKGADVLVSEVLDDAVMLKSINKMASTDHWSAAQKAGVVAHMKREHMSPAVVAHLARTAHVRSVILHHFVPGLAHGDVADDIAGIRAGGYKGQLIAGRDLARYCVDSQGRTGPALSACAAHNK